MRTLPLAMTGTSYCAHGHGDRARRLRRFLLLSEPGEAGLDDESIESLLRDTLRDAATEEEIA